MSELIKNTESRLKDLLAISLGMMNGEDGRMLIEKYKCTIENLTPLDMLNLQDRQLKMGIDSATIKKDVDKVINVFYESLNNYQWEKPEEGTFLFYLMLENQAYTFKLNQVKKIIKSYKGREAEDFKLMQTDLLPRFMEFFDFESHYLKKENILFPYLEKIWECYRPLKVMWSLHDDIRTKLKSIVSLLKNPEAKWIGFNKEIGKYFFMIFGMMQKEDFIVYPVAAQTVEESVWKEMQVQSFEYPFAFIEPPPRPDTLKNKQYSIIAEEQSERSCGIKSETGRMNLEQTLLAFNHLPVEITFVDEYDKVVFFNKAKDRFFPRSPAVVGRAVQNCHPPESVHIVEEIIEAFRSGKKDLVEFWIQIKGKFIFIQYFAVRNESGEYRGVLEVSQNVTGIRDLKGEKRLY